MGALLQLRDLHPPAAPAGGSAAKRAHLRSVPRPLSTFPGTPRTHAWQRLRSIGFPFAVSVAAHGLALVLIAAMWGGGGAGSRALAPESRFFATLVAPPQRFVVPEQPKPPEPVNAEPMAAQPKGGLVGTAKKQVVQRYSGTSAGQASILPLEETSAVEPWLVKYAADVYPGVPRIVAEFEVPPASVYPAAAAKERRQAAFTVPVLLKSDGSVELMPRTFADSIFAPAIVASLASARTAASDDTGAEVKPVGWALLTYMFEFTGEK